MTINSYLYLDGIKGTSKARGHLGEIELLRYFFGGYNSSPQPGSGVAAHMNLKDISIVKKADFSSPILMDYSSQGKRISKAKLTVEEVLPDGWLKPIMSLEMEEILISSFQFSQGIEQITLDFNKFKYLY